ncbi:unnamed protein product, partial [Adineta steineri]
GAHRHRVQLTAIGQLDLNKLKQNKQETQIQECFVDIKHEVSPNVKPLISINLKEKQPIFDNDGFWCIDAIDIEYIAYGAGILGCGGGGESYHFKLLCLELLREGKYKMRVAPPSFFSSSSD